MSLPRVSAVVLNHREADQVVRLLRSLRRVRYPGLDVVVVDNDSGAADLARLSQIAEVVESGANLGYAGGNNVGIEVSLKRGADFVWILNPDVEPARSSLRKLVRAAMTDDSIGVVGGRIMDGDAEGDVIESEGGRIDWVTGGTSVLLERGRRPSRKGRAAIVDVDFVPGAAMLVRASVFESIGLLPEDFFMYFEETEFCVRAAAAGFRVVVAPSAFVSHYSGRRQGLPGETYLYYFVRNRLLFGIRHTEVEFDRLVADVEPFIQSWRDRVAREDVGWASRFEELVRWAIADAREGRSGRRLDVGGDR